MKLRTIALAALLATAPLPLAAQTPEETVFLIMFGHDEKDANSVFLPNSVKVVTRSNCIYYFEFPGTGGSIEFDFNKLETTKIGFSADGRLLDLEYEGKQFMQIRQTKNSPVETRDKFNPTTLGIDIPASESGRIYAAQERFIKTICKPSPR